MNVMEFQITSNCLFNSLLRLTTQNISKPHTTSYLWGESTIAFALLGLCDGNEPSTLDSPEQGLMMWKTLPCRDIVMSFALYSRFVNRYHTAQWRTDKMMTGIWAMFCHTECQTHYTTFIYIKKNSFSFHINLFSSVQLEVIHHSFK